MWRNNIPKKIQLFGWRRSLLGRLSTRDELAKHGVIRVDHDLNYAMYFRYKES